MTGDAKRLLDELTGKLKQAFGADLRMAVLFGSGARDEMDAKFSDLNVLCVLTSVGVPQLRAAEPVFHWWRSNHNPSPLLLSEEEFRRGSDAFPIEFHDIADSHRLLAGEDLAAGLVLDDRYYRGQVEHELRAKLLRLRQKAGGVLSDKSLLLRLMADSVSTFANLARHALRLAGHPVSGKREALAACGEHFGLDPQPFYTLLDLRAGQRSAREIDPLVLLGEYLRQIEVLTAAVDRLAGRGES